MSSRVFTIAVGAIILIAILVYLFSFEVRETQTAVVLTFGKASSKPIDRAGLYFQWPWPIQSVVKYDKRLHTFETRLEETLTADKQNITVSLAVGWRIVNPIQFRESFGRRGRLEDVEQRLDHLVSNEASIIAQYKLENLVSTDPTKIKFDTIEADMAQAVSENAVAQFGVEVPLVRIRRLELPEIGATAVKERMKEERNKEAKKYRAQGQGAAAEIRARADSIRKQILARAEADAQRIRAQGEAKAAPYYEKLGREEALAEFLKRVDAIKHVVEKTTTLILDKNAEPFPLFDKGLTLSDEAAAAKAAPGPAPTATP